MKRRSAAAALAFAACSLACTSLRSAEPRPSGFLGDTSDLEAVHEPGFPERLYLADGVEWERYRQVLVDPVTIWRAEGEAMSISMDDAQRVANNFALLLRQSLGEDYELVEAPTAGTLRVQVAVTEITRAAPVMNVITSAVPFSHTVGALQAYVGLKPPFAGASQVELRVMDATSATVLMESVDRRIGTRHIVGAWESWKAVDDAMAFWSQQLRYVLCVQRGGEGCALPSAGRF